MHFARALSGALLASIALGASDAEAASHRSAAERAAFKREHPCPATGQRRGACPGYQIDHVTPLKCGGADHPSNMQWLTVHEHKDKTRREARLCRSK